MPREKISAHGLRRAVGTWGSFTWGYADVGADVYVAVGLVAASAQGLTSFAFLACGLVYLLVGLAYTELASTYPVAGGSQYYALRGLGDFFGFTAGWALMLDFSIDISLFGLATAGYLNSFIAAFSPDVARTIGFYHAIPETIILVGILVVLNIIGIQESSRLNEWLCSVDLVRETGLLVVGFAVAFSPMEMGHEMVQQAPHFIDFLYGASIAIVSFIGLESISQAAEETVRPATIVPRTSLALICTVLIYALGFSTLGIGLSAGRYMGSRVACTEGIFRRATDQLVIACSSITKGQWFTVPLDYSLPPRGFSSLHAWLTHLPAAISYHGQTIVLHLQALSSWTILADHQSDPVAAIAAALPYIGIIAGPLTSILAAALIYASTNTGIMGCSRIAYSMANFDMLPAFLSKVVKRFRTPMNAILAFGLLATLELIFAGISTDAYNTLADMYAFGALTGYIIVQISLIKLRHDDPESPRAWKVPFNISLRAKDGLTWEFPVLVALGILSSSAILGMVIATHDTGRIVGPLWLVLGWIVYYSYRRTRKLPFPGSIKRDWEGDQKRVLQEAEEYELLADYQKALRERDKHLAGLGK